MVQDLRATNEAVVLTHPIVPNPYTILTQAPGDATWFTVLDFKDAFFCFPPSEETRPLCAFEWVSPSSPQVAPITWTVLSQGLRDSSYLFGA